MHVFAISAARYYVQHGRLFNIVTSRDTVALSPAHVPQFLPLQLLQPHQLPHHAIRTHFFLLHQQPYHMTLKHPYTNIHQTTLTPSIHTLAPHATTIGYSAPAYCRSYMWQVFGGRTYPIFCLIPAVPFVG